MSAPALALIPVLIDTGTGTGASTRTLDDELLERAARDDYHQWLGTALAAGGCVRPIRLRGTIRDIDPATGEILHALDTDDTPDKVIYLPCGDRRASVCPPCAETYRADTYQLIRAGLAGGKGVPESVAIHPCVFATFTAPSFGPVHTRVITPGGTVARCRPRRKASYCPHGRRISCGQRHNEDDACLGTAAVPGLLRLQRRRRLERPRLRAVAAHHHHPAPSPRQARQATRRPGPAVLCQGRRVPAPRPDPLPRHLPRSTAIDPAHPERTIPPHPAITADVLADLIRQVAASAWFATVAHPAKPNGWDITWGAQVDPRVVRLTDDGEITDVAVASYLAKYATKSTEPAGIPPGRITADNAKHLRRQAHPPGTAHHRLPQDRRPPAPGLPGPAPLGAHARLPRPLRHQKPPLLHHHARPPRRPPRLATPPAPPGLPARRPARHHTHRPANGPDEAGAPAETPSSPCRPPPEHASTGE